MDERVDEEMHDHLRERAHISPPPDLAARAVAHAIATDVQTRSSVNRLLSLLALASIAVVVAAVMIWGPSADYHRPSAPNPDPIPTTSGVAVSTSGPTASPADPRPTANESRPTDQPTTPITGTPSPSVGETPAPTEPLSDLERSDRFWRGVTDYGPYNYEYSSLDEMALEAHLIVRGQVVGFASGVTHPYAGDWPPYGTIIGLVEVVEILKGKPNTREVGIIEVQNLGWSGITDADLPGDEVILFLMNDAEVRREYGVGLSDPENQPFRYWRPNPYQSALRIINGDFRFLRPGRSYRAYRNLFPAGLDERAVESVINDIREVVEAQGADD